MTELPAIPEFDTPRALRRSLRDSAYPHPTFGAAPGYLQCNILILPHGLARDFSAFCAANPQACPVIYECAPGQFDLPELGEEIDLRTDIGSYRVFRDGQAVGDLLSLQSYWQGDFVTFLIGSSWGLDGVLTREGIATPWVERGETPAHYITGRDLTAGAPFRGPMAVSMRPVRADDAERLRELCAAYPHLHGLPLEIGDPDALGIETLEAPVAGTGNTATVAEGEIPVFWASALSVQLALSAARLPLCIANTPGYLLVTDIEVDALREAPLELTERVDAASEADPPAEADSGPGAAEPGAPVAIRPRTAEDDAQDADALEVAALGKVTLDEAERDAPDAPDAPAQDGDGEDGDNDMAGAETAPAEAPPASTEGDVEPSGDDIAPERAAAGPGETAVRSGDPDAPAARDGEPGLFGGSRIRFDPATGTYIEPAEERRRATADRNGDDDGDGLSFDDPERPVSASRLVRERLAAARVDADPSTADGPH